MSRRLAALMLLFAGTALVGHVLSRPSPSKQPTPTTRRITGFRLQDPRDRAFVSLADFAERKAIVVVFLGTECPINNAFLPVLAGLHRDYSPRKVQFLGINSNRQDTPERVAVHARKHAVPFPVLKDPGNKVADLFDARRTPEAFLLNLSGKVLYRGRIDDQFGTNYARSGKPKRRDLAEALDEVLAGKPVSVPETPVAGCRIARTVKPRPTGKITYTRHVSRIIQNKCQECHRPGRIGPMALLTYDDVLSWSDTIREVVSEGRMPPWHADPRFGKWANDRRLSPADRTTLLSWLDHGMPKGEEHDLPPPRKFVEGWSIGTPDLVLKMQRPYAVPARMPAGGIPYQYFNVRTNFKEDRWIERAEAQAGAPGVVHHIVVFIVAPGETFDPEGPGNVLCGTAPGDLPMILPPGQARKVPAGARLLFQMHYTPNGTACKDQSRVGLIFAKKKPEHRILTRPILNGKFTFRDITIPAGANNFRVEASHTFRGDAHLIAFMPHMHLRGKDFLYEAIYPNGRKETLLSVPRYDFNWQTIYQCARPLALPKGTRLHCIAHFDNSVDNPSNPDPKQEVSWGDQTWEEMMIGWIDYYLDDEKP